MQSKELKLNKPVYRKLRAYAFDPSLSLNLDTVQVNHLTYRVMWEVLDMYYDNPAITVPSGEYIEIIDVDPASEAFYKPVNMDDPYVLAQDGLNPSVSNPQFHQQMVYAVVMTTIQNFEQALGRKIQWAPTRVPNKTKTGGFENAYIPKLRIYPHALRQANAYYDPQKKSLLFGYFPARPVDPSLHLPGGTVFTCLSHDIIAHETTHAILDGLHRRYIEDTHPDTRAFHEGFADIVALFQHFSFPEVLRQQIARTRGNLAAQNLLGQLAQEFGKAMGNYGGLRDAIGHTDPITKKWVPHEPNPQDYSTKMEFHDRGAILVAAIFEAFLRIYQYRIRSLMRIATGGSGILPDGDLHPDMVDLLAQTAAETANRVLKICVRALDYCPPVDITFGDYLRALITADVDMVPDDERNYRVAFVEAFQKRGIFPTNVKTMSVESLAHNPFPDLQLYDSNEAIFTAFLRAFKNDLAYETDRKKIADLTKEYIVGGDKAKMGLHQRIDIKFIREASNQVFIQQSGLMFPANQAATKKLGFDLKDKTGTAYFAIENLWLANRVSPDGKIVNHVIVSLTQKRGVIGKIDDNDVFSVAGYFPPSEKMPANGFIFRGGCTLIFDLDQLNIKYVIRKGMDDMARMENQYRYQQGYFSDAADTYFSAEELTGIAGPFAFMHAFPHQHND